MTARSGSTQAGERVAGDALDLRRELGQASPELIGHIVLAERALGELAERCQGARGVRIRELLATALAFRLPPGELAREPFVPVPARLRRFGTRHAAQGPQSGARDVPVGIVQARDDLRKDIGVVHLAECDRSSTPEAGIGAIQTSAELRADVDVEAPWKAALQIRERLQREELELAATVEELAEKARTLGTPDGLESFRTQHRRCRGSSASSLPSA